MYKIDFVVPCPFCAVSQSFRIFHVTWLCNLCPFFKAAKYLENPSRCRIIRPDPTPMAY